MTTSEPLPADRRGAAQLLALGVRATAAYGRPDLTELLEAGRPRIEDPSVTVLVVGEFKQGKSSLVNALVGAAICPVDDDIATAVPTAIRFGSEPSATVVLDGSAGPVPRELDLDAVPLTVTEEATRSGDVPRMVEVVLPADLLASGLVIVDTPGVGGLGARQLAAVLGALPLAAAVLFVTDAGQELTAPELDFLRTVVGLCPTVVGVLTKADLYPELDAVAAADREHLQDAGLDVPLVPVSAELHRLGTELGDAGLVAESGIPALRRRLGALVAAADRLTALAVARQVGDAAAQMTAAFEAERAALADPGGRLEAVARLERAKEEADRLRAQTARWQQQLNDRFADLTADVDHDLRTRIRRVAEEADERVDEGDPRRDWSTHAAWLEDRMMGETVAVFTLLTRRVEEAARAVADLFEAQGALTELGSLGLAMPRVAGVVDGPVLDLDAVNRVSRGLNTVRNTFYGFSMFTSIGALVGLAGLALPAGLVLGVAAGGRQLRDEKARELNQVRHQARGNGRRYLDEVGFVVGKETRDAIRLTQRRLRDHFAERAQALHRSTSEALRSAQQAAGAGEEARAARLADVEAELKRLRWLHERAVELAGTAGALP